jgi:predicted RNase H-like HicB family nuclease
MLSLAPPDDRPVLNARALRSGALPCAQLANGSSWAASMAGWAYHRSGAHFHCNRPGRGRPLDKPRRWSSPAVMTYGQTREEAISNTDRLAIEVIADRIKHAELPPSALNVSFQVLSEQMAGD